MDEERFEEFSTLISGVHGNVQKLKARYTAQLGLKPVYVVWLYLLRVHKEGLSASELAAAGKIDRSLVSRELDFLLKEGIVTTSGSGERRRYGWKLTLTEKGEELANTISAVALDIQKTVSRSIPPEELAVFYNTLKTLAGEFENLVLSNNMQETIDSERKNNQ